METLRPAIEKAQRILVVTHVGPDGDALGSLTAVGVALSQLDKQVDLVCDDNVPERFRYLPGSHKVQSKINNHPYDLLIAVDCGDESRMGNAFAELSSPLPFIINIDHHVTNSYFGNVNVIDATATSTAEILYALLQEIGVTITADIALSLLTGLVTDTLGFRTIGVTAKTLKVASALVEAGADLAYVTTYALTIKQLSTVKLWQIGLDKMQVKDGLIWASISHGEQQAIDFNGSSTNGLVNILADIDEAAIGVALLEMNDGSIRVGWRCRPPYNVAEIASDLGGGGHPLASGCTLPGPLEEAEALVVARSLSAIQATTPSL
jgi:phosphoesterase RecJ-like protein